MPSNINPGSRVFLASGLLLACLCTRAQDSKPPEQRQNANPVNLKVLKVNTTDDVNQIMRTFTAGLGVQCSYCHVSNSYASDDNPKKEVARQMIGLTKGISMNFNDGKMHVSCYTCHRGQTTPATAPDVKP